MKGFTTLKNDIPILAKKDPNAEVKEYLLQGDLVSVMSKDTNKGCSWRYVERLGNGTRGYVNWTEYAGDFYKWKRIKLLKETGFRSLKSERKRLPKQTIGYFVEVNNPLDLYVKFWTEDDLEGTISAQATYEETLSEGAENAIEIIAVCVSIFVVFVMLAVGIPLIIINIIAVIIGFLGFIFKLFRK